ncbi:hypothetical protein O7634_25250 [Micromonospora sp. WMMD1120]|uniref:hypothetical protein n=1 Tax=Micromonospora sp. WMMD1120 TaxID=3016106 RepID=UPI0024162FC9|nr:hypothetical protein [Micromonospora sp. WMMD1120]MDG4810073.1 hypothetical protein [Micromonospora sp. WMMD1120]
MIVVELDVMPGEQEKPHLDQGEGVQSEIFGQPRFVGDLGRIDPAALLEKFQNVLAKRLGIPRFWHVTRDITTRATLTMDRRLSLLAIMSVNASASPPAATHTEDAIGAVFGTWMIAGGLVDAWAHVHVTTELESFATPYHAVLYSGFFCAALWTFVLAYRRRGNDPYWWWRRFPAGYRLGALGAVGFLSGGVADAIWHQFFGVEADLEAILSPTHFMLNVSAMLIVTSPMRSWWAEGVGVSRARTVTGSLATALGTSAAGFFLVYASAFASNFGLLAPVQPWNRRDPTSQLTAIHGLTCYLVTTAIVVIPLLLIYRRRPVPGAGTLIVALVALFTLVMYEFPGTPTVGVLLAVVGAAVAELVLHAWGRSRPDASPTPLPVVGAVFAALLWGAQFAGLHLADGVRWPVELWSGTIVLTALTAAVLGGLAQRPSVRRVGAPDAVIAAPAPVGPAGVKTGGRTEEGVTGTGRR